MSCGFCHSRFSLTPTALSRPRSQGRHPPNGHTALRMEAPPAPQPRVLPVSSATPASLSQHPLQRDPCVEALVLPCRAEGLAVAAEAGWPPASASPHLRGLSQVGWDRQSVPLTHGSWNAGTHGASVGTAHVVTNMAKKNSFSRFLLPAALWPMERPARQRRLAPCALHAGVPSHAHLTAQRPEHRKCPRACGRGSLAWGQPYLRTAPRPACTARSPARGAA